VDGINEIEVPLSNVVVDNIVEGGGLSRGAAFWMGNAIVQTGLAPQEIAKKISIGEIDITKLPIAEDEKIASAVGEIAVKTVERIANNRKEREKLLTTLGEGRKPYLYVIVATGNIYEDVIQAQAAANKVQI
jgi:D-Lysine 5,6-aminomutase alpha subunit.